MDLAVLTPEERKSLLLSVGTHRGVRPLSPFEVAALLRKAVESGTSLADCAEALHLDGTSWISRFLSLLKLPADAQHVVSWGRSGGTIAFTSAFELSRLDDGADQRYAVHAVLRHNLTSAEVRQLVQAKKRSTKPIEACLAMILKMRPQIEVRHVFIGAVRENLRPGLQSLTQQQRDSALQTVLTRIFKGSVVNGRLGPGRFTLSGGAELDDAANSRKDEFEQQINAALAEVL